MRGGDRAEVSETASRTASSPDIPNYLQVSSRESRETGGLPGLRDLFGEGLTEDERI